jgi:hypothetical protein
LAVAHAAYAARYWGFEPLWRIIKYADHWAGWVGGGLMALSLLYVPRKKKWIAWGKVPHWYRFHVLTGLTGPLLVILHAYGDYHGVGGWCLWAMWLVLMTGVIGHFIYRRLPEEVEVRAAERQHLLKQLEEATGRLQVQVEDARSLLARLDQTGPLAELAKVSKIKMPRPTLTKSLKNLGGLWRNYRAAGRRVAELKHVVKAEAEAQRHAVGLRERELLALLHLERDTRTLIVLNEIYSLWRKAHVPLSWLMWWLLALHVFAWAYY